jgi:hypothetical protein
MPFVTTGVANSAFGAYSMFSLTVGNFNTAVGVAALDLNNADSNTAVGAAALLLNTDGTENTATGTAALQITPQLTATRLTARLFKAENSPAEFVNERGTFSRANDFRC